VGWDHAIIDRFVAENPVFNLPLVSADLLARAGTGPPAA
jgi:hypothetical protein